MNEPKYIDTEAGESAEKAVLALAPADRWTLAHRVCKADIAAIKAAGWKKAAVAAFLSALTAAGLLGLTSCTEVTPAQVQGAHAIYHVVSGQPCILVVEGK